MSATTISLAIELALQLLARSQRISSLVSSAQSEGRDLSPEEWKAIMEEADAGRQALLDAIAKAP